jgi:hypothetical protein
LRGALGSGIGGTGELPSPPFPSCGILSDVRHFLLHRPSRATLVRFDSERDRENYRYRILQRLGVSVDRFAILNIHRIGIQAPARYVFEEFLEWNDDSTCWPNHIATVRRREGRREDLRLHLFGTLLRGLPIVMFELRAVKIRPLPDPLESDNARYALYECGGGYPIGIYAVYVRSSIAAQGEVEPTQMFIVLGFNFFGREDWSHVRLVNRLWHGIHDRVTTNVLNRFKQLCEWKFDRIRYPGGRRSPPGG